MVMSSRPRTHTSRQSVQTDAIAGPAKTLDRKDVVKIATVVTNVGKAYAANKISNGNNAATANFIGWGTGAGTAAVADTTIFTEAAEARVSGTQSRVTTTVTNDTAQIVGTLTSASGQTITNVGLLDASTSGNLCIHSDFAGLPLLTGDSIQFTIKWQFS
jgi:hypothetical protein